MIVACPNCGRPVQPDTPVCATCGRPQPGRGGPPGFVGAEGSEQPAVRTWLVESIFATLCCCLISPIGIAFAAQANSRLDRGDIEGARRKANVAKILTWVSVGLGVAFWVLYGVAGAILTAGLTAGGG